MRARGTLPTEGPDPDPHPRRATPGAAPGQKRAAGSLTRAVQAAREPSHGARRGRPGGGRAARAQRSLRRRLPSGRGGEPARRVPSWAERASGPARERARGRARSHRAGGRAAESAALRAATQTAGSGAHALICMSFASRSGNGPAVCPASPTRAPAGSPARRIRSRTERRTRVHLPFPRAVPTPRAPRCWRSGCFPDFFFFFFLHFPLEDHLIQDKGGPRTGKTL